ncbi:flp pilus-assembly TadE/G-like family protein [Micromonospora sp. NBC_01655]|uniref:Rv3654c family TadE-like protein n=1 Tax=Micromonospora sp. NBC_01655 TaxID=2975983 RepID=UPI0022587840|nr:Rv3654c family TadE-like protein [Micromonospora sp. NBC_01655]MCX4468775.1 flp pilus-assembly TadE/G-like family protein [Micromonospora sp. NBC_01655]
MGSFAATTSPAGGGFTSCIRVRRRDAGAARRGGERGGATVCLLAAGMVFVVVGLFGAAVGAARMARQQARVAADFGALAGAGRALAGGPEACAYADEVVRANGARLTGCRLDGLDAVVTAEVTVAPVPGLTRVAIVTSRAGPPRG